MTWRSHFKLLHFDLERVPALGTFWEPGKQYVSPDQLIGESEIITWSAKWDHGALHQGSLLHQGQKQMLLNIHALMEEADAIITWNGDGFDFKVLNSDFLKHRLRPPAPYKSVDLLRTARSRFGFMSNRLDNVLKVLGHPGKLPHPRSMWLECMGLSGKTKQRAAYAKMLKYNAGDVEALEWLYPQFRPWIKNHPHMNLYIPPDGKPHCDACGSTRVRSNGLRRTMTVYRRWLCLDCGTWNFEPAPKTKPGMLRKGE